MGGGSANVLRAGQGRESERRLGTRFLAGVSAAFAGGGDFFVAAAPRQGDDHQHGQGEYGHVVVLLMWCRQ